MNWHRFLVIWSFDKNQVKPDSYSSRLKGFDGLCLVAAFHINIQVVKIRNDTRVLNMRFSS